MKCMHAGCMCEATAGQEYCSEQCRQRGSEAEQAERPCGCGHAACQM